MKQSFSILALGLVLASSACGGSPAPDAPPAPSSSSPAPVVQPAASEAPSEPDTAAYDECLREWAQGVADLEGDTLEAHLDDPDVIAVCEGFRDAEAEFDKLPAYTPAPAAEVDPACLRDYAEGVHGPDGMFPGLTVEEIMEDPMARFTCE